MTNGEIKLVAKALCYTLGSEDRYYKVTVSDNGILLEYVCAEIVDREPDPQIQKETEVEIAHVDLPLIADVFNLSDAVREAIEEIESVGIEYKKF